MKEIIMFTSSTCPHCKTAKRYLDDMGFKYIEKNVQLDRSAQQEMVSRKLMGVPSFIIGNETLVGLDKNKIEALIDYTVEKCPSCGQRARVPKGKGKVKIKCKSCGEAYTIQTKSM